MRFKKNAYSEDYNKWYTINLFIGGKKAVAEHAAVWVPDGEAPVCMHCKKTQFTLINRRVWYSLKVNINKLINPYFFSASLS